MAARITQVAVEAVILPTSQAARVTQLTAEAVVLSTAGSGRITQLAVEAVILPTSQVLRVTAAAFEVLIGKASAESFGWARAWLALPIIANRVVGRSRRISFAGGVATFRLDPSEIADLVVVFGFKGVNIGAGRVTWQMVNPTVPAGTFEIVSDDEEVLLVFPREATIGPPEISFAGSAAALEVHMVLFSYRQLEDLRAWMRLRSSGRVY